MEDRSLYANINDPHPRKLKGSQFLDTAERKVSQGISYLKDASQDREGIGDDLLRLAGGGIKNIGKVASTPGIKHALQIAGAPAWAAGQAIGAGLEHGLGIDPRYGHIAGEVGEMLIPGYGVTKLGKAGKLARRIPVPGTKTRLGTIGAMRNPARIPKATVGELSDRALQQLDGLSNEIIQKTARPVRAKSKRYVSEDLNYIPDDIDLDALISETQNIRLETADKIARKGSLDQIESSGSTLADISKLKNDPRVYNSPKFRSKYAKYEAQIEGAPALEWHHKNMKTLTRPFVEKMEQLIKSGKASEADLLNLGFISLDKGVGMGDRYSALIQLPRVAHQKLHKLMRLSGIEPTGKALKNYKSRIQNIDNAEDLTKFYIQQIDEISGPMTSQAKFLEAAYKGVDEYLLDNFAGLTAERNVLRLLRTRLKKGSSSTSEVMKQRTSSRTNQINQRIKEIENLRTPIKKKVQAVLDEKLRIAQERPPRRRL